MPPFHTGWMDTRTHARLMPLWCPFASWEPRRETCSVFECVMRVRSQGRERWSFEGRHQAVGGVMAVRWSSEGPGGGVSLLERETIHFLEVDLLAG